MKIYLFTFNPRLSKTQQKSLESLGDLTIINAQKLTTKEVLAKASDAEVIIAGSSGIESFSKDLMKNLKHLKFLSLLTVGTTWVDIEYANKMNLPVSIIKGASSESVAEHSWGMILALLKKIYEFNRDAREEGAYAFGNYKGKEVFGKTIGIIGTGDIGSKVARIAKAFEMKILGINKRGRKVKDIEIVKLEKLLKESDVISVCAPLNEETKGLISDKEISKMKDGVIIVNCAREEIVDKKAVINGIKSGKVFGYGVETEIMKAIPKSDSYFKYKNIIATPHNAFFTEDADRKSFDLAIENIQKYFEGKPQNLVTHI